MTDQPVLFDNRYVLHERLGQGGMGIVYRATDRLSGDVVALKQVFMSPEELSFASRNQDDEFEVALAKEFQTLASLRHPNIISVLDYGFDEKQRPYFTMDYLENADPILQATFNQSLEYKVDLIIQLLHALNYLHRRGILHRDLKPGNVLVVENKVKLLDFGLAIKTQQATEITGTLAYIAPEILQGDRITISSDLYAVGVILYEAIAGRHPFDLSSIQKLVSDILSTAPNLLALTSLSDTTRYDFLTQADPDSENTMRFPDSTNSIIDGTVSGELDISLIPESRLSAVVGKLLSKKPQERYPNSLETIYALLDAMGKEHPPESQEIRESFLVGAAFIGREDELARLEKSIEQLISRKKGSAWLIGGESGVGKSRLLEEIRTRALVKGIMVLKGQGINDGGLSYEFWRQPLRRLIISTEMTTLDAQILKQVVPDIDVLLDKPITDAPEMEGQDTQRRLLDTIIALFKRQTRPVVLILEDLQWATESLEVLKRLVEVVDDLPVIIIGSYRREEKPDLPYDIPQMLSMVLERLDAQDIANLSYSMLGVVGRRPAIVDYLQAQTEGNAFFLVEVVRALAEEAGRLEDIGNITLPTKVFASGIEAIIERRLNQIPEIHQPALRLAAVAGRQIDLKLLEVAASKSNIDAWLVACSNAAVVDLSEGTWRFVHDKLRKGVLDSILPNQLPKLHLQIAKAMEKVYADSINERAILLARHWALGGNKDKERHYAFIAGQQAEFIGDFTQAHRYYKRVEELLARKKHTPEIIREKINILFMLGRSHRWAGEQSETRPLLERALKMAIEHHERDLEANILNSMSYIHLRNGDYEKAGKLIDEALAIFTEIDHKRGLGEANHSRSNVAYRLGRYDETITYLNKGLAFYEEIDYPRGIAAINMSLGSVSWSLGNKKSAREFIAKSLDAFRTMGSRHSICLCLNNLGIISSDQGEYEAATAYYDEALAIANEVGAKVLMTELTSSLGWLNLRLGNHTEARQLLEQSLLDYRELNNMEGITRLLNDLGELELAEGNIDKAFANHQESLQQAKGADEKWQVAAALRGSAAALARQGKNSEARQLLSEGLAIVNELEADAFYVEYALVLTTICQVEKNFDDVIALAQLMIVQEDGDVFYIAKGHTLLDELKTKYPQHNFSMAIERGSSTPAAQLIGEILDRKSDA